MTRLLVVLGIILFLGLFIWLLKNHLTRNSKEDELREAELDSDLIDIEKEIVEEKVYQKNVSSEIEELKSENNINEKENSND
jgi:hypothetical protein